MPGGLIIAAALLLAMVFAVASGGAFVVARNARLAQRAADRRALEAVTRAALLESALHDVRRRRSAAVAKGNRTRGAAQAELRAVRLKELREAAALRAAGGQHSLPLGDAGADRSVGAWCTPASSLPQRAVGRGGAYPTHSPKGAGAL